MVMGPIALEGIFTASLMAIARSLADHDSGYDMEQTLSIFVRDEMFNWISTRSGGGGHSGTMEIGRLEDPNELREIVNGNVNVITKRALGLATTQSAVSAQSSNNTANQQAAAQQSGDNKTAVNTGVAGSEGTPSTPAGQTAVTAATPDGSTTSAGGVLPACQNVIDLVSKATDPAKLGSMDGLWFPWL